MAKYFNLVCALAALTVGSSCSRTNEASVLTSADFAITDNFRAGSCKVMPEWFDVGQGSNVDTYLLQSNGELVRRRQHIEQNSQGVVRERSYWEGIARGAPEERSDIVTEYWRGLLPLGQQSEDNSYTRRYTYLPSDLFSVEAAKLGDTVDLSVREIFQIDGKVITENHVFRVKYKGCGSIKTLDDWEPVRVYDLTLYGLSYRANKTEIVRTDVRVYYSGSRGWYFRKDRPNGTFEAVRSIR